VKTQNLILLMLFGTAALCLLRQVYPEATGRVAVGVSVAGPRQRGRASVAVSGVGAAILPWLARR
jgi:hypothetical protein